MKYLLLIPFFVLISCGTKEAILLPKSNVTIVSNVEDRSPIYIFFRKKAKDTLVAVNRKNEIISTNWVFNIDKRLPLRLVLPEVMKLQEKKRNEVAHKNELTQNYYSYADSLHKNLAFLPFTEVVYKMEKPKFGIVIFFTKNNTILVNNELVSSADLQVYLQKLPSDKPNKYFFCFAKELLFGNYVQDLIFIKSLNFSLPKFNLTNNEFIY